MCVKDKTTWNYKILTSDFLTLWQVTAYRHMICISPLCAISCLTHIYSVYLTLNTTLTLYHIYILYLVTTLRDVFVSWGQAAGPRQAWRTLITNLQLQETIKGGESSNWLRNPIAFLMNILIAVQEILLWISKI